jgi:hypothetical protein
MLLRIVYSHNRITPTSYILVLVLAMIVPNLGFAIS